MHGHWIDAVGRRQPDAVTLLVDLSGLEAQFGAESERLTARKALWESFAAEHHAALRFLRLRSTGVNYRKFYWADDQNPEGYDTFRLPTDAPQTQRQIEDIAPEELAAAVRYILQTQFSLTFDDLIREVAALFRIPRCTTLVQQMVRQAVNLVVHAGDASVDEANNRVSRE